MNILREIAKDLDSKDKLHKYRNKFILPKDQIYLDGNSLGVLAKGVVDNINHTIKEEWGNNLISSWNKSWIKLPRLISKKIASIIKSYETEVYVGSSTSINLFKLLKSILEANSFIKNITTDNLNFPSDKYICEVIAKDFNIDFNFLDYGNDLIPDIEKLKENILKEKGILVLSHVSFKSSYRYPIEEITKFCKDNNTILIWDLSHSVGAIDIDMRSNGVDYAIGCTYKYLNGGPGSPAFIYVRECELKKLKSPIKGWFSHNKPFEYSNEYIESNTIEKFSNGTPHILSLSTLKTSLDITLEATTEKLSIKSANLFDFFITIYNDDLKKLGFKLLSPLDKNKRGSHISLSHKEAWRISKCLLEPIDSRLMSIIVDFRPKNIIRIALTPLYTTFEDVYIISERIISIINDREYNKKDNTMEGVT
ncbi:MAG: kynureninase [Flavobacteriaceae bacterium]|nr:kynureninase [Flavobacteriaceae bacterium]